MPISQKITQEINTWLASTAANYLYKKPTLRMYTLIINSFLNFIKNQKIACLNEIDTELLTTFIRYKPNKKLYAKASINQRIAALDLFFSWALDMCYCRTNPILAIKKSKIKAVKISQKSKHTIPNAPDTLTTKEQAQLIRSLDPNENFSSARDACIIALILESGLYAEELINLEIKNFQLEKGYIDVMGTRKRRIMFDNCLYNGIYKHWLTMRKKYNQEQTLLFFTKNLKPITKSLLYQQISTYFKKANIQTSQQGADILRQTAIHNAIRKGNDFKDVQQLGGYKKFNSLERYINYQEKKS